MPAVRATPAAAEGDTRPGMKTLLIDDHALFREGLALLMLVSAFAGHDHMRALYRHAIEAQYRFFSYGDAMLLGRQRV